jgi:undecaprenyl-diphosphatase
MTFIQALILGIVQGLTEFLPISSSAHLVLVPYVFGWELPPEQVFSFDVLVQLGTLVAVIGYFWKDLWQIFKAFIEGIRNREPFAEFESRMAYLLILATIPAGVLGLFLEDIVENAFQNPRITAFFLLGTALLLWIAEVVGKRQRSIEKLTWKDALWVGFAQVLAMFPGVSRSGATIAAGMTRDLKRPAAGRFSFLMSVPVMLAAGGFSLMKLLGTPGMGEFLVMILVGFIAAAIVGYLSIHWMLSFLVRNSLKGFSIYCTAVALIILVFTYVR